MNVLDRIIDLTTGCGSLCWANTVIEISPRAFELMYWQSMFELTFRVRHEDLWAATDNHHEGRLGFAWIHEVRHLSGDAYETASQGVTIATGSLCRSSHERLA